MAHGVSWNGLTDTFQEWSWMCLSGSLYGNLSIWVSLCLLSTILMLLFCITHHMMWFYKYLFCLISLQGWMYKSCVHQTCKRVDADRCQRANVGSHACRTDVFIELYIQLKLDHLYDGHLYSVSSKSQWKRTFDCWKEFCVATGRHQRNLGAHYSSLPRSTTVCIHTINI